MRHSAEALTAFAKADTLGSFSAAARKLSKSQHRELRLNTWLHD